MQAIYENICLINHNCQPNVAWNHVKEFGHEVVYALRNLKKDEELLVNYIEDYLTREERQMLLYNSFQFKCTCDLCSKTDKESDHRRKKIRLLDEMI